MSAVVGFFIGVACGVVIGVLAVIMIQVREDRQRRERDEVPF